MLLTKTSVCHVSRRDNVHAGSERLINKHFMAVRNLDGPLRDFPRVLHTHARARISTAKSNLIFDVYDLKSCTKKFLINHFPVFFNFFLRSFFVLNHCLFENRRFKNDYRVKKSTRGDGFDRPVLCLSFSGTVSFLIFSHSLSRPK